MSLEANFLLRQHRRFLMVLLFIEGGALMSVELMGAKLLAPFYGSSLFVWTAVMSITVLGLAVGYALGGKLSAIYASEKILVIICGVAGVWVWLLPQLSKQLISLTSSFPLVPGICSTAAILLVPPMLLFGMVGPFAVECTTKSLANRKDTSGRVYFTSTLGGVLATLLVGFYAIPCLGLIFTSGAVAMLLICLPLFYLVRFASGRKRSAYESAFTEMVPEHPSEKEKQLLPSFSSAELYFYPILEGAAVMAVELLAARMLAPYFGSSLYVWASVIGITLTSLAAGYFIGGKLANRQNGLSLFHWVLLTASVFLMCMHFLAQHLISALQELDVLLSLGIIASLLILPPLVLLGMIPTLVIRYISTRDQQAGTAAGTVFTLSSVSGIVMLFVLGFFVIPQYGLTIPSIIIGVLVGIIPLVRLLFRQQYLALIFFFFFGVSLMQQNRSLASSDVKIRHVSEGILGQVIVADIFTNGKGESRNDRLLFVNRIGQSQIDNITGKHLWNYITFSSPIASKAPEGSHALLLGLGGGSVANMLSQKLRLKVDAVELDDRIAKIARTYFALSADVNVVTDDARHFIETTQGKYNLIFVDVFKGDQPPTHVLTVESFTRVKQLLNDSGILIVNFNGFLSGEAGKPGRSVFRTLEAAGFDVNVLPTPGDEMKRNTLFVATVGRITFTDLRSPLLFKGNPVRIDSLFTDTKTLDLKNAAVFTDDQSSLERMNIKAANLWRAGYNQTYTRFFTENHIPLFF